MPDTIELKIRPMTSGSAARPEYVGLKPSTTWNQRGRNTIAPKKAKAAKNTEIIDAEYARLFHRSSGTIGSFARASARTNSTLPMMPMRMNPPTVGSVQSPNCLLVRPTSRNEIATVKIAPPRMSKLRVADGVRTTGRSRWITISATMPIGMLT